MTRLLKCRPSDVLYRIAGASDQMGDHDFAWDKVVKNNWRRTEIIDNPWLRYPVGALDVLGQAVERTAGVALQMFQDLTYMTGMPSAVYGLEVTVVGYVSRAK